MTPCLSVLNSLICPFLTTTVYAISSDLVRRVCDWCWGVVVLLGVMAAVPAVRAQGLGFVQVVKDVGAVDGLNGVSSVTVSPDGQHVYAASFEDDAVTVFSRNASTGALTFVQVQKDGIGSVDGLDFAMSVTVSPDGGHVYATGLNDNAVAVFSRHAATGALTFVEVIKDSDEGVDGLDWPRSVTVSPDGQHVYTASERDNAVAVFSRNGVTGALTFVEVVKDGDVGVDGLEGAYSVAVSPDGAYVYAAGNLDDAVAVFSRNAATGALTFVEKQQDGAGGVDGLEGAFSVTVSLDGAHVYAAGSLDDAMAVFSRDATTGALTYVEVQRDGFGGVEGLDGARSVTVSGDDNHLYAVSDVDDAVVVSRRLVVRTLYVATTGSDAGNDCRQAASPCLTIGHAVGQANDGDTVSIAVGTYFEPGLLIAKALHVQGQGVVMR